MHSILLSTVLIFFSFKIHPINLCTKFTLWIGNITWPSSFLSAKKPLPSVLPQLSSKSLILITVSLELWKHYLHSVSLWAHGASSYAFFFLVGLYFQSTHLIFPKHMLFKSCMWGTAAISICLCDPGSTWFQTPPLYTGIKTQGIITISIVCYWPQVFLPN